jgi:hypothetical protein
MFNTNKNNETNPLDRAIDDVLVAMKSTSPKDEKYPTMVEQLDKLYKIRLAEKPDRVSKDALLAVAGNLLGIGLILNYEQAHVIATKALGFVSKARI